MIDKVPFVLAGLLLAACAATPPRSSFAALDEHDTSPASAIPREQPAPLEPTIAPSGSMTPVAPVAQRPAGSTAPKWRTGEWLMQGFLGVNSLTKAEVDAGGGITIDSEGDLDNMPVIGGGGQLKLGGDKVDLGLEAMFAMGWEGDVQAFAVGGGGAAVAVDVDLLIFEIYGGPFASVFLGDKLRAYASAGPLMQWADYEQSGSIYEDSGSGFGFGYYGRLGLEFALPSRMWIGIGGRWSDTEIDLDGGIGDFDAEGYQFAVTFSRF